MASTGGVKLGSSHDEARTRKINAEAEIAELTLQQIHNTLVLADDVVAAWQEVLGAFKSRLLAIPVKAAPIVSVENTTASCKAVVEDLINEALEELSNYDPTAKKTEEEKPKVKTKSGAKRAKTATKANNKRVGRPGKAARLTE
jgi:hypothetical protein